MLSRCLIRVHMWVIQTEQCTARTPSAGSASWAHGHSRHPIACSQYWKILHLNWKTGFGPLLQQSLAFRPQPKELGWDIENSVAVLADVILRQGSQTKTRMPRGKAIITACPGEKVSFCIILTELGWNWAAFCIRTESRIGVYLCPFLDLTPFVVQLRFWACRHPFPLCFGEWIDILPLSWPSFNTAKQILSWF